MKAASLPKVIVSGASGFIGRHLIQELKENYIIYALARRSQKAAGVLPHQRINWIRVDISDEQMVKKVLSQISEKGRVDYFIHLAAHYDFNNTNDIEYTTTNINGTHYLLDNIEGLCLKRFIFASSLTVTNFKDPTCLLNEKSPANESRLFHIFI